MNISIVFPPMADPSQPYAGVLVLAAALRAAGFFGTTVIDANVDFFHYFVSPQKLHRGKTILTSYLRKQDRKGAIRDTPYNELSRLLCRADYLTKTTTLAIETIQSPRSFYNYSNYEWAVGVINDSLRLSSFAYSPTTVTSCGITTDNSNETLGSIIQLIDDPLQNPFIEFYEHKILPEILENDTKLVGISITYQSQLLGALTLARLIKSYDRNANICLGGAYFTRIAEDLVRLLPNSIIDYGVIYEGESAIVDLAASLQLNQAVESNSNLFAFNFPALQNARNKTFSITCLEDCPDPDYSFVDFSKYLTPEPVAVYDISRGCYWNSCAFCSYGYGGGESRRYRERPIASVIKHLKHISRDYKVRNVVFTVDALRPHYLLQLADAIITEKIDISWQATLKIHKDMDKAFFHMLKKSGCSSLIFGIESGCDRVLNSMQKGHTATLVKSVFESLAAEGIKNKAMFITGFPGETYDEAMKTRDFLVENRELISFVGMEQFFLQEGALIAELPQQFAISINKSDFDDVGRTYSYGVSKGLTQAEASLVLNNIWDEISIVYNCQPYPYTRSGAGAHSLLHSARLNRNVVTTSPDLIKPPGKAAAYIDLAGVHSKIKVDKYVIDTPDALFSRQPIHSLLCIGSSGKVVPITKNISAIMTDPTKITQCSPSERKDIARFIRKNALSKLIKLSTTRSLKRVRLDNEQQESITKELGFMVSSVDIDTKNGLYWPTSAKCNRCLLYQGLPSVQINASGLCNYCQKVEEPLTDTFQIPIQQYLEALRNGKASAVVAYSGGKDSSSVLAFLKQERIKVVAVMIDNGYIPNEVVLRSSEICRKLGFEFRKLNINLANVVKRYLKGESYFEPCKFCMTWGFNLIGRVAKELNSATIFTGHKYPPGKHTLKLFTDNVFDERIDVIRPYILCPDLKEHSSPLLGESWYDIPIKGSSTNCTLLGSVESFFKKSYGYDYRIFEISDEIRSGAITKKDGLNLLQTSCKRCNS